MHGVLNLNQIVNNSFTSFQLYCNHRFIGGEESLDRHNDLIDESCGLATKRDVGIWARTHVSGARIMIDCKLTFNYFATLSCS